MKQHHKDFLVYLQQKNVDPNEIEEFRNFFMDRKRSKREDINACKWNKSMWPEGCKSNNALVMRCSEHCGNTVRDK